MITNPVYFLRTATNFLLPLIYAALFVSLCVVHVSALEVEHHTKEDPADASLENEHAVMLDGLDQPLKYTTYFYTAAEAIIHGFKDETDVRIISVEKGGTVWQGTVNEGQTVRVSTGQGVFSFVADKKASILVGTPTTCAVTGYWLRDADGSFRSDHLFGHLPSSSSHSSDTRIVVWAWEDISLKVTDKTADKLTYNGTLKKGTYHEIESSALAALDNHVLDFRADKPALSVQVYYDEGFFVPAKSGVGSGRLFYTYVGNITGGANDLNLISYHSAANASVIDLKSGEELWSGIIEPGGVHTLTLHGNHVKIESDQNISVLVAPYKHYSGIYAEHHFGLGSEGMGIDTDFLITTTRELWIFSYYPQNHVEVTAVGDNQTIWSGTLENGQVQAVHPGHGLFRIKGTKGFSVMGGAASCGAEFSPASNLFAVDEALFRVVKHIQEQRRETVRKSGREITQAELKAPLSREELHRASSAVKKETGQSKFSPSEVSDRLREIQKRHR